MTSWKSVIGTKTFAHSLITTSGTIVNGILGLLFFIFLARNLDSNDFGVISLSVVTITLISDIADLGINTGLMNFISKLSFKDQFTAYRLMKLGLELKLLIWLLVLISGWAVLPLITQNILLKPSLLTPLRISMIGAGGAMLFSYVSNCLQAFQKFSTWSVLNIATNALRLLLIVGIFLFFKFDTGSALYTYIGVPFLGFVIGLLLLPRGFLSVKGERDSLKGFFNYNKWVALSVIVAALASRLDSYLTARFLSLKELGVYSVATQLTSAVSQMTYAVAAVAAPKLGSFDTATKAKAYLVKLELMVLGLAGLGLLAIPLAYYIIPLIYGSQYVGSILPFIILYIGQLFFFISIPSHQAIFYYFSNPRILFIITSANLIINISCGLWLVSSFGIIGAAFTMLTGNLFLLAAPTIYTLIKFGKNG